MIEIVIDQSARGCWNCRNISRVWIWIVLLLAGSIEVQTTSAQTDGKAKPPLKEIRQGGYVEKVEPGVDYKDRLPRFAPKTPSESLKAFHIRAGFHVELVATEPLIRDPVDIAFDEDGRMIVAELVTYSESRETKQGRVSVLDDTNNDGRYDSAVLVVDQLEWPCGVLPFDGGLFISSPPDLLYCKDTNGDGRADLREVVFTGFDTSNPNQCANSLRWNLDNRIEMMPSGGGGLLDATRWNRLHPDTPERPRQIRGRDMSFEPRSGQMRSESGGSQYGMTFDAWGRKFESSNSAPIEMVMYEDRYLSRNPYLAAPSSRIPIWKDGNSVFRTSPSEPWRVIRTEMRIRGVFSGPVEGGGTPDGYFTSASGVMVYQGSGGSAEIDGNAFVCEGANNLVHRMRLEPDGVAVSARRVEAKREFLTSDEVWCKPVQLHNGPDGALYVVDMYREIYEHPQAVPPSVRKYVDLNSGNDRGRIYRVVPDAFQRPKRRRLGGLASDALIPLLADPDVWARRSAARLIYERQDASIRTALEEFADSCPSPLGRMHALYALSGLHRLTPDVVTRRLADDHPRVREQAVRLSEHVLAESPDIRQKLYAMTADEDVRVRYQLAFTLGNIPHPQATAALAELALRDGQNRWVRFAVLSSCLGRTGDLLEILTRESNGTRRAVGAELLEPLAEQAGLQKQQDQIALALQVIESKQTDASAVKAITRGLSRGLAKSGSPLSAELASGDNSTFATVLGTMIATSKKKAADPKQKEAVRVQAAQSLALARFPEARDVLTDLLDGRQPQAVQMAAVRTLARFPEDQVADLLIAHWQGFSPHVRAEASEALFARPGRLRLLLAAVSDGTIASSQLAPNRIQFLLKHPVIKIRNEASELFNGKQLARREEVVEAYRDILNQSGEPARGKKVFKRECSQCHQLEGVGYNLGLPLQTVKSRGPEGVLIQILDPNREVNPSYLNYSAVTVQGRMATGIITSETSTSITLTRAQGERDIILRSDIDELYSSDLSIMPEGLEDKVSKSEMADLLAYLLNVIE